MEIEGRSPVVGDNNTRRAFQTPVLGTSEARWESLIHEASLRPWRLAITGAVVLVSPHPDDETLATGGIIHDLAKRGWRVTGVAVTDGEAAYGHGEMRVMRRLAQTRRLEQTRALAL